MAKISNEIKNIIEKILLENGKGKVKLSLKEIRELSYINNNNFVSSEKTLKRVIKRVENQTVKLCIKCNLFISEKEYGSYVDESNEAITKNSKNMCLLCNSYL